MKNERHPQIYCILHSSFFLSFKISSAPVEFAAQGLEKEPSASCTSRMARRLRRTVTSSPASSSPPPGRPRSRSSPARRDGLDRDLGRQRQDDGAVGQRVRTDGRQGEHVRRGQHNRPARRQGIRRGTGRRTDDQPVAPIPGDGFAIHAHVQAIRRETAPRLMTMSFSAVSRIFFRASPDRLDQRAGLQGVLTGPHQLERGCQFVGRHGGEKAQPADVHP